MINVIFLLIVHHNKVIYSVFQPRKWYFNNALSSKKKYLREVMLVVNVKFGLWEIIEQVWGRKLWSQEQKKRVWKRNILKSMNSYLWIFATKNISTLVTWLIKTTCNIEKKY